MTKKQKVTLLAPFPGELNDTVLNSPTLGDGIGRNMWYAERAMNDSLFYHEEAPFVPQVLYFQPGLLDKDDPIDLAVGLRASVSWQRATDKVVACIDQGLSPIMKIMLDVSLMPIILQEDIMLRDWVFLSSWSN